MEKLDLLVRDTSSNGFDRVIIWLARLLVAVPWWEGGAAIGEFFTPNTRPVFKCVSLVILIQGNAAESAKVWDIFV